MDYADISLLEFRIINTDNGPSEYSLKLTDKGIESKAIVTLNIDHDYLEADVDRFIYITVTGNDGPIEFNLSQEYVKFTKIPDAFSIFSAISIDNKYLLDEDGNLRFNQVNFKLAYTHKHPGEIGISESLRHGTFFSTKIPLSDERGK